jgi:hypothetical protein
MKIGCAFVIFALLCSTSALATMPLLPDMPRNRSSRACRGWAEEAIKSDQDVAMMWGLKEDGTSSGQIAIKRLVANCLRKEMPEIVGFYSSAGVAQTFCETHMQTQLCKKWKLDNTKY